MRTRPDDQGGARHGGNAHAPSVPPSDVHHAALTKVLQVLDASVLVDASPTGHQPRRVMVWQIVPAATILP
jgi:hypothetical protein